MVVVAAIVGVVRHGERVRTIASTPPEAAAVKAAVTSARSGGRPDGLPTLLLVATPGCDPCERARHDLRFLVRPEDLGVRAHVLLSAESDPELGVTVTPTYLLVDGEDRLLAVAGGYRPPLALRDWMREELAQPSVRGLGRKSRNAMP